jgi:hypothetical protein
MSDFHTSLDAALHRVNPLLPGDESDYCPVCGCRLRDNRLSELKVCPFAPHEEPAA